jgi:hypothetical protein
MVITIFHFGTVIVIDTIRKGQRPQGSHSFDQEEKAMKSIFKKVETMFAAAAFAEEGEFETARQLMNEEKQLRKTDRPSLRDTQRPANRPTLRVD